MNYCDLNTIKEALVLSCNIVIIDDQQLARQVDHVWF